MSAIVGLLLGMLIGMIGVLTIVFEFEFENYTWWWRILPWITGIVMSYVWYIESNNIVYIIRYRWNFL